MWLSVLIRLFFRASPLLPELLHIVRAHPLQKRVVLELPEEALRTYLASILRISIKQDPVAAAKLKHRATAWYYVMPKFMGVDKIEPTSWQ